jgi:hypothetical protein
LIIPFGLSCPELKTIYRISKSNSFIMSRNNIVEFLRKRGFVLRGTEDPDFGLVIQITNRSIGGGLNEIFVETDELNAIEQLGSIMKIIYGDNTIKLNVKVRKQSFHVVSRRKKRRENLKEKLDQRKDERGGK